MNDRDLDRLLDAWMDLGPTAAPDRVADAARLEARSTRQRRAWWPARRYLVMNSPIRIALAAAGVVAAVFVVLLATPSPISLTGGGLFGDREPTSLEIAEAYIEARNDHDPERASELLTDGFWMDWPPVGHDRSTLALAFEMHRGFGFNYSDGDCREGTTATNVVTCDYLWTTEVHRISGHSPTPTTFTFYLIDGRIFRIDGEADAGSWYGPFYDDFLAPEHPEFAALLDEGFTLNDPEVTREVAERLPHYFELYEEWLSQQP
jgi:hypothetical protein